MFVVIKKKKLGQAVGRQYRYGLKLISTQGKTFWNIVRSDVKILRQVSEVNLNPSEYTFQSLQIQNLGAETRAIWKQFDFGNKKIKFYTIFCFIIISHIQLKFIGKENPIWAREDLIKKFCFQIELVLRQDIRTVHCTVCRTSTIKDSVNRLESVKTNLPWKIFPKISWKIFCSCSRFPPTVFLWLSRAQHSLTKHALEIMFLFQPIFKFLPGTK